MLRTPVSVYMTLEPDSVLEHATLDEVAARLDRRRISALPVVDSKQRVVGVVSRRDLLRVGAIEKPNGRAVGEWALPASTTAADVMARQVVSVAPSTSIAEAAALMLDNRVHRVFVGDSHRLRGVVTTRDVMRAIVDAKITAPMSRFASPRVHAVETTTSTLR